MNDNVLKGVLKCAAVKAPAYGERRKAMLQDAMSPQGLLPGLREGQTWTMEVYGPLRPLGGSISAEHGIGFEKRPYLQWSRSESEIDLMHTLKQALDPKGILNPGKVLPD